MPAMAAHPLRSRICLFYPLRMPPLALYSEPCVQPGHCMLLVGFCARIAVYHDYIQDVACYCSMLSCNVQSVTVRGPLHYLPLFHVEIHSLSKTQVVKLLISCKQ